MPLKSGFFEKFVGTLIQILLTEQEQDFEVSGTTELHCYNIINDKPARNTQYYSKVFVFDPLSLLANNVSTNCWVWLPYVITNHRTLNRICACVCCRGLTFEERHKGSSREVLFLFRRALSCVALPQTTNMTGSSYNIKAHSVLFSRLRSWISKILIIWREWVQK